MPVQVKHTTPFLKSIEGRTVTGLFAVHGVKDAYNDISMPGSIGARAQAPGGLKRVRFLWQHAGYNPPIASIKRVVEVGRTELPAELLNKFPEATGAVEVEREYYEGVQLASWVFAGIKSGDINEMSYAYDLPGFRVEEVDGEYTRYLTDIELYDISDVNWGANAATLAAKAGVEFRNLGLASAVYEQLETLALENEQTFGAALQEVQLKAGLRDFELCTIINGQSETPPKSCLENIAGALGVEPTLLISAAEKDGAEFSKSIPLPKAPESASDEGGLTFTENVEAMVTAAEAFKNRVHERIDFRAKEGRVLSTALRKRISECVTSLGAAYADLEKLLKETEPEPDPEKRSPHLLVLKSRRLKNLLSMSTATKGE